jgi:amino acid transporter
VNINNSTYKEVVMSTTMLIIGTFGLFAIICQIGEKSPAAAWVLIFAIAALGAGI